MCISTDGLVHVTSVTIEWYVSINPRDSMYGDGIVSGDTGIGATLDAYIAVSSSTFRKISIFTTSGECVHEVDID